jgi:antitoxin MazE
MRGRAITRQFDQDAARLGIKEARADHQPSRIGWVGIRKRDFRVLKESGYTCFILYIQEGTMQVAKWGNSLAIRLPAAVVEALDLKAGDEVEINIADRRELIVSRKPGRQELLQRLRAFRGRLPADFKFDRDDANAR